MAAVSGFGNDIRITPRQSYIALARKQQFAVLKAGTATRFDLGLRLKNPAPSKRLSPAQGLGGGSINYKISLTSLDEVDEQVVAWLKQAYEAA
jgi:predicted transport protein